MQVTFQMDVNQGSFFFRRGQTYDLDQTHAQRFISQGVATTAALDRSFLPASASVRANAALKEMATSGASGGQATTTFAIQIPALDNFTGGRPIFANYSTAGTQTIALAKCAPVDSDLNNGATAVWATCGTSVVIPAAVGAGATQVAPGLAFGNYVTMDSVARADAVTARAAGSSVPPLLQVRSLPSTGPGSWGFAGTNAPAELFTSYGREYGVAINNADQVTTITGMTLTRNNGGNLYLPCVGFEFAYNRPVTVVASAGDSLIRGQTDGAGSVGFRSLDVRVCALKNSLGGSRLWSPMSFPLSGQQHTSSYLTAVAMAQLLKPRYMIIRGYSVNDAATLTAMNADYAEMTFAITALLEAGTTPILLTTGGTDGFSAGAAALLAAANAKLLALRNAGAIVIDVAGQFYGSDLKLLPAWYGADGTHTHPSDALYDAVAAQIAAAIS